MIDTESARKTTRLEFYLPGGRHFTLIRRGTWLGLKREGMSRSGVARLGPEIQLRSPLS
jgi:hypothetical protein